MRHTLALLLLTATAHAANKSPLEYVDLLSPEVVGELGSRDYDTTVKVDKESRFLGQTTLGKGMFVGAGVGLRVVLRWDPGVRISVEGSAAWGDLRNVDSPFRAHATAVRGELLSGIGFEHTIAKRLTLHTATIVGLDIQEVDATGSRHTQAVVIPGAADAPQNAKLRAIDLRLGQQVGLHIHLVSIVALYADATFDYDGQYRIRAGIALGIPGGTERKDSSSSRYGRW
jgi:hypothetical protein